MHWLIQCKIIDREFIEVIGQFALCLCIGGLKGNRLPVALKNNNNKKTNQPTNQKNKHPKNSCITGQGCAEKLLVEYRLHLLQLIINPFCYKRWTVTLKIPSSSMLRRNSHEASARRLMILDVQSQPATLSCQSLSWSMHENKKECSLKVKPHYPQFIGSKSRRTFLGWSL